MTVMENLLVGQHSQAPYMAISGALPFPFVRRAERDLRRRAADMAAMLGLESHLDTLVTHLPYGLRKMTELARALVSRPKLVLLDEPAAGLEPKRDGGTGSVDPPPPRRGGRHRPAGRARHGARHGRLRADLRARLRQAHRGRPPEEVQRNRS